MALSISFVFSLIFLGGIQQANGKIYESAGQKFRFEVLTQQKGVIWGFDFLSENQIIFTQRSGALKIFDLKDKSVTTIKGSPKVWAEGQGGLLDVRVHPTSKQQIYLTYSEPLGDGATTAFGRGSLDKGELKFKKLFSTQLS